MESNKNSKPILKNVLSAQKKNLLAELDFLVLVSNILSGLKEKQQKVIVKRFGLDGGPESTLASIGNLFNITRERVRQIEQSVIAKIKDSKKEYWGPALEFVVSILQDNGGIISEERLMEILLENVDEKRAILNRQIIKFLLILEDNIINLKETDLIKKGYGLRHYPLEIVEPISKAFAEILEAKQEVLFADAILTEFIRKELYKANEGKISPEFLNSCLELSNKIIKTPDGGFGLVSWPHINPRTIRDKAHYVLSRQEKPMHFRDIAAAIEKLKFDNKRVTIQTVHNELIADERFVLVGRGVYGLSQWGFEVGTVADVIKKILEEAGRPMTKEEIINKVLEKKQVQKSTILVNLQTNPQFQKVDGNYTLAQNPQ